MAGHTCNPTCQHGLHSPCQKKGGEEEKQEVKVKREPFSEKEKGLEMRSIINQDQQGDPNLAPLMLMYMFSGSVLLG